MRAIAIAAFCLLVSLPALAADITKEQYKKTRVGMTLSEVEAALGRAGTNEGKVFYVWAVANLRVGIHKNGLVAEFDLAAPGKKNELFEKFKKAFMDKVSTDGKPLTRSEIDAVVGQAGAKTELTEYVWRNSNKARIRVLVKKGKVVERSVSGRLK